MAKRTDNPKAKSSQEYLMDYFNAWATQLMYLLFFIASIFALFLFEIYVRVANVTDFTAQNYIFALITLGVILTVYAQIKRSRLEKSLRLKLK